MMDLSNSKERIHFSSDPALNIKNVKQINNFLKPNGIWYQINNSWEKFCYKTKIYNKYIHNKYRYELYIDLNNILILNNKKKILNFIDKYDNNGIDWNDVSRDYHGIEISPYIKHNELSSHQWYMSWDTESGCIWNTKSININNYIYNQTNYNDTLFKYLSDNTNLDITQNPKPLYERWISLYNNMPIDIKNEFDKLIDMDTICKIQNTKKQEEKIKLKF